MHRMRRRLIPSEHWPSELCNLLVSLILHGFSKRLHELLRRLLTGKRRYIRLCQLHWRSVLDRSGKCVHKLRCRDLPERVVNFLV